MRAACEIYTVDAFTGEPFRGNPAGVCLLSEPVPDAWMQSVAAELRHAETAFLHGRSLRWFTPTVEVALCGHATLAVAHVLYADGRANGRIEFATRSGPLTTEQDHDGGLIVMDFPAKPAIPAPAPPGLVESLNVAPTWTGRSDFDLVVEVASAAEVRAAMPDFGRLAQVETRGVILTAAGSGDADFVSRFFAPRAGVPEDPVTGSAHCTLAPYWSARFGRPTLVGAQLSERGGIVRTVVAGDRVKLAGRAVTIWSGQLHAPAQLVG
jgi:predicted PhzF superfamily epimerase YddE/YHI9